MSPVLSATIQVYSAWRILQISKSVTVCGVALLFAVGQLSGGLWSAVDQKMSTPFKISDKINGDRVSVLSWLIGTAAADIVVAMCMAITVWIPFNPRPSPITVISWLQLAQSRTAFSQTNTLMRRIHIMIIGTTCLTGVLISYIPLLPDSLFLLSCRSHHHCHALRCRS